LEEDRGRKTNISRAPVPGQFQVTGDKPICGNDGAPIYCPIEHHEWRYARDGLGKYEGMSKREGQARCNEIAEDDDILSPRDEAKRTNWREDSGSWRYLYIHTHEDPEHILKHIRDEATREGDKLIDYLKEKNAFFDEHEVKQIGKKPKYKAITKSKNQQMWDNVMIEAQRLVAANPDITLVALANSSEVNLCFPEGKEPAIETIVKHLQGKGLSKRGRPKSR
jgi:hypothetical protein